MLYIFLFVFVLLASVVYFLPQILNYFGLHPNYPNKSFDLSGRKALIINTNQATLEPTNKATGLFSSEMTVAYYEFLDANVEVDLASIEGGVIPIDPLSLRWPIRTQSDLRMLDDPILQEKLQNSKKIADLDFTNYDIIFVAGGWGASYDLGYSELLGQKMTEANAEGKLIGSVCHGGLALINAKNTKGGPLVKNRRITAVTNKQIRELGITVTPMHPESELRKQGAIFESQIAFRDMFANFVVKDGNLITGQNQNSAKEVAQKLLLASSTLTP